VSPETGTTTFKYDPFGRRIQKISATSTTNYVYDGANLIEEVDAAGTVLARYTQSIEVDEPLVATRGRNTRFYQADGLGSITSLASESGAISSYYVYDSFGNLTASHGSFQQPFGFTGRELDPETGLMYYRARYYDPAIGRFISEDPLRFKPGDLNAYAYADGNPVDAADPFGLQVPCPIAKPSCRHKIAKHLTDCVMDILRSYLPGLDMSSADLIGGVIPTEERVLAEHGWAVDAGAMTWDNTIYYKTEFLNGSARGISRIGHELLHIQQQRSEGLFSFGYNYIKQSIGNYRQTSNTGQAYQGISYEKQGSALEQKIYSDLYKVYRDTVICKEFCK
jgi:RHS repeat-associated protein